MKDLSLAPQAPWRQRYRAPKILWGQLASQNPANGLVCTDRDGIFQLYAWDTITGDLQCLTDAPAGIVEGVISADGHWVYYHLDQQGNEIGHFVRIPFDGGSEESLTPQMPLYSSFGLQQSFNGVVLGFTRAHEGFTVIVLANGEEPREIYTSKHITFGPVLSAKGEIAVVASTEHSGTMDFELLAYEVSSGKQIASLTDGEDTSITPGSFSPVVGDLRMLASTSKSGFDRPLIWNPATNERFDLPLADLEGEIIPWDWSPDGERVLLCQLHKAIYHLHIYDLTTKQSTRLDHPDGVLGYFSGGYFVPQGDIYTTWQDSANPSCLVALDGKTGALKTTILLAGEVPAGRMFQSVNFPSENGEAIQAWLSVPDSKPPYPAIIHIHGGPTSVQTNTFSPFLQSWLDHGFAVLSVNYHGSTTFGKSFEKSIWGNLGELEVQDLVTAAQWLIKNQIASKDEILLTGGSYGGYLTLMALGKSPEIWAGGMAQVAIADWRLMWEDQAEALRGYQRALFGGSPDEVPQAVERSSPITYAEKVVAPLLVIQGENDTRCPARQMQVYEERMRTLGKQLEILWFDAGHGSRAQEEQIEHQEHMLRFAYRVLG